ncbi:peptide/nickel transport system substrate-binding protein [Murinocardiopsis flavida]|uniref:Peptide/nickel transport system substrate-binding protein n=1 Tax=Murinocardiopsis flavida TaxID=645275 RepID=A0A2P8CW23_9ACTN|nr:ABC transporter substrate-binding protein [Murinocardiopsis flavida]PSK89155.1 peptide/nickel transport system substrate-binding protein [Murinocardiopsis flavida]
MSSRGIPGPVPHSPGRTPPTRRELLRYGAVGAVVAPALAACGSTADPDAFAGKKDYADPRRGGRLRVGIAGGSAKDSIDAHLATDNTDIARVYNLYDRLTDFSLDYKVVNSLAESLEPNAKADVWTVTLRKGLTFHGGAPVTAEDVVFSLARITDPDDPKTGAAAMPLLDRDKLKAVDDRTAEIRFSEPMVHLPEVLAEYYNGIVPKGYDPKKPIGTGPFRFKEFEPGVRSLFVRNGDHWRDGEPFVDELEIINFPDDTARVNALLGGQVDAISQLPHSQVKVVHAYDHLDVLESESGMWLPFTMRVDRAPFDDERVRQAFRLIVDRQQMVDQALSGYGTVANDIYGRYDPAYADDLPQREQDIAKAKELLADAGHGDGLEVELVTAEINAGVVEAAEVFAEQAKEAGVTVKLNRVNDFFAEGQYLEYTFSQDFWAARNYLSQAAQCAFENSPFNETHWADEEWTEIVTKASATVDDKERNKLLRQAQEIEYERGGYIIWGNPTVVDAFSKKVKGFKPFVGGHPLTAYGFRQVWFEDE